MKDILFKDKEQQKEFEEFRKMTPEERMAFSEKKKNEFCSMTEEEQKKHLEKLNGSFEGALDFAKKECEEIALHAQLGDVSRYVSLAQISSDYFGKTKQWLYQRIKGYSINGKPAKFTDEEKERFRAALLDISDKIKETALNI